MSLYVYAIVDRGCRPPAEWRGLEGSALSTVAFRSIAAVVSEISAAPDRSTAALMQHEALVEALADHHRTLPVRFGTVFPDAAAVTDTLSEHHDSLAADLERVGDKVELGLLALWRTPPTADVPIRASSGGEGARYLQSRQVAYARADTGKAVARQLAREVELAMHDHAIDHRISIVNDGRLALRATYLVAPADVTMLRDVVDDVRRKRPDVAIILTGPWPPYSFVSGGRGMDVERLPCVAYARSRRQ